MTRLRCDRTPAWVSLQAAYDTHGRTFDPVSYTHLTLPTIYSV